MTLFSRSRRLRRARRAGHVLPRVACLPLAACLLCTACQDRRDPVKPTVAQAAIATAVAAH